MEGKLGMRRAPLFWGGVGFGAVLALLLDPVSGARRRAFVRDKGVKLAGAVFGRTNRLGRDFRNRARGLGAKAARIGKSGEVDDEILVERVRSKFGRIVTHPKAISMAAEDGVLTLKGPVLSSELDALVACAKKVRGVKAVVNRLSPYWADLPSGYRVEAR